MHRTDCGTFLNELEFNFIPNKTNNHGINKISGETRVKQVAEFKYTDTICNSAEFGKNTS